MAWIETRVGVEVFLGQIRDSLKSGEFAPVEVRQVMIPKASGKFRKLGIPTVADRVVQASLKAVLEPIFEADFSAVLVWVPPEPARAGRDRRDPLPGQPQVLRVGAGGRHQGVFRRDRAHGADGPAAGADQGQAGAAHW